MEPSHLIRGLLLASFLLVAVLAVSKDDEGYPNHGDRSKRAIGGQSISRGDWPWLALMRATIVTRRIFGISMSHHHLYCGGVLIADRWILSAAHCFMEFGRSARRASNWEARLGTVRLRANVRERVLDIIGRVFDFDALRNWEVDVERLVIHPRYNQSGIFSNDIAMIKLARPVPSSGRSRSIQAIALPSMNEEFPVGSQCITKGWGCTHRGGGPSRQARQIPMPIQSSSLCTQLYGLSMDTRLCAGHENSGVGVCSGDSGSPLVCRSGSTYKLVGIVSLTSQHRPESFPAVFTSVKAFLPWIRSVMTQF